jgi:hypothetical protein
VADSHGPDAEYGQHVNYDRRDGIFFEQHVNE